MASSLSSKDNLMPWQGTHPVMTQTTLSLIRAMNDCFSIRMKLKTENPPRETRRGRERDIYIYIYTHTDRERE